MSDNTNDRNPLEQLAQTVTSADDAFRRELYSALARAGIPQPLREPAVNLAGLGLATLTIGVGIVAAPEIGAGAAAVGVLAVAGTAVAEVARNSVFKSGQSTTTAVDDALNGRR